MPEASVALVDQDDSPQRYNALCDRAVDFVLSRNGAAPEELLIVHVFGNSGSPKIWRPLLRSVLAADPRVRYRADGQWVLSREDRAEAEGALLLDEFVAIDVETTGLRPTQQRIIEIALIRYARGVEVRRFQSLVQPQRSIPKFITQLTTITDEDVADAPLFGAIAEDVLAFVGDSLLVGHNVGFDFSFINAELKRFDQPILINDRFDTLGVATRYLKGLRKPNLQRVAEHLGLLPTKLHRAANDASLTAEVALRLADEAIRQGVTSLHQLKVVAKLDTPMPRQDVGLARTQMDPSMLAGIPRKPGVYLMRDAAEQVIYVGKSKNLRDRVRSYYGQPIGYTRKMDGLLEAVRRIETIVVGSDIEAMLLESQLIHRYEPRYNTAMRSFEHYPYIKVDISNPWPRISVSKQKKQDGARYFGPYQSSSGARKTVEVLNRILPLRTCTRSFKSAKSYGSPCIQLDMGRCAGPCNGLADRDAYFEVVRDAVAFLDGQDSGIYDRIWNELELATERLDFERAQKLRQDLRSVLGIVESHKRLRIASERHNYVVVLPSGDEACRELLMILGGRVWKQTRINRDVSPITLRTAAERMLGAYQRGIAAGPAEATPYSTDERHILNRWLARQSDHKALLSIEAETVADVEAWAYLISTALSFKDEDLVFLDRDPVEPSTDADLVGQTSVDPGNDFGSDVVT